MEKKVDFHLKEGQRCYKEANQVCLLIPDIDDREMAISLFKTAIFTSLQGMKFSSVVTGLISMLADYGINVYKEWNKMNTLLLKSQSHFELSEYYKGIVDNNGIY